MRWFLKAFSFWNLTWYSFSQTTKTRFTTSSVSFWCRRKLFPSNSTSWVKRLYFSLGSRICSTNLWVCSSEISFSSGALCRLKKSATSSSLIFSLLELVLGSTSTCPTTGILVCSVELSSSATTVSVGSAFTLSGDIALGFFSLGNSVFAL